VLSATWPTPKPPPRALPEYTLTPVFGAPAQTALLVAPQAACVSVSDGGHTVAARCLHQCARKKQPVLGALIGARTSVLKVSREYSGSALLMSTEILPGDAGYLRLTLHCRAQ